MLRAMTPGYKTKGFWLTILSFIVAVLYALGFAPDAVDGGTPAKVVGLVASVLAAAGYAVSRGRVKLGTDAKPAWKQTEFYLSIAAFLVAALMASGAFDSEGRVVEVLGIAAGLLAMLGYGAGQKKQTPNEMVSANFPDTDSTAPLPKAFVVKDMIDKPLE